MLKAVTWFAVLAAVYHLVVLIRVPDYLGIYVPAPWHRAMSLIFVIPLVFIVHSARGGKAREGRVPWYDWLFIACGVIGAGFVILFLDEFYHYWEWTFLDVRGVILAGILAITLLEAARRVVGWALPIVIVFFALLTIFQNFLPWPLYGRGYPIDRLLFNFYGIGGIFGIPLGIAATIIITFVTFATFVMASGGGHWFSRIALSLAGWTTGGIAKAAVLASALFGTISGSPSGNTAATGSITIPLMTRHGYDPAFAGAVEAVASTGGSILPPVMGAIAFIMAEWTGVSYARVALAAALPAVIYYVVVFASVHFEACRKNLASLPRAELPPLIPVLREGWFFLIPLFLLVYLLLIARWPPAMSALLAIPVVVVASFLGKKEFRLYPRKIFEALAQAVKLWLTPAATLAAVGMLLATIQLSGLGVVLTRVLLDVSGDTLIIALLLIGVASLILGMGLDAIPLYITLAVLAAPGLIKLGVPPMAAHLFVIYWGLASFITPPVALTVFVACGISGASVWKTGFQAVRLAPTIFVVPVIFAMNPALLLGVVDTPLIETLTVAGTAILGAVCLAAGLRGYALKPMNLPQRLMAFAGGLGLLWPVSAISLAGFGVITLLVAWQVVTRGKGTDKTVVTR